MTSSMRNPQGPAWHLSNAATVEPRFRGGAQRLGMRATPFNLRGRAFHALSLTDGARCRAKPRPAPDQPVVRRRGLLPVELGRVAGNGCAPIFVESSL